MSDAKYTDALKDAHSVQRKTQGEAVITLAVVLGEYYKALIENGIPEELASDLVLDFHSAQLELIQP